MFFLLFGQQVDHASEGRRNWLLKLGRHEDADGGEVKNLWSGKVLGTNHVDVSVEDACCDEQRFHFVAFAHVEVEDFLNSVASVFLAEGRHLSTAGGGGKVGDLLAESDLLLDVKVVLEQKGLLERAESQITDLSKLRVVLMLWCGLLAVVENWVLLSDVFPVDDRNVGVGHLPPIVHDLGVVGALLHSGA